jgi:ATP phosphoribosyltransferase regulatory subunit
MTIAGEKGLLPAGLTDGLPPFAAQEAQVVERLVAGFAAQGYDRVKPPLLEFEDTLLSGADSDLAQQTFRLMDPVSQRMLGLRADMTPQVARIAATRLGKAPRPLRLCYGGQVLQVKGTQMRPERQFGQVGVELIGAPQERADAEVILLAAEALAALGIEHLSIDLNLPTLVGALADILGMAESKISDLSQALDRKDVAAVGAIAGAQAPPFAALLRAAGPAPAALDALRRIELPETLAAEVARLCRVIDLIRAAAPELTLTVDLAEHRGFEYHSGISFIVFARGVRGELGRGGRYSAAAARGEAATSSTGFTLYMDSVLRALPKPRPGRRIYLPPDCAPARARDLRADAWVTLAGLDESLNARAEAARLGCSHVLLNDRIEKLEG